MRQLYLNLKKSTCRLSNLLLPFQGWWQIATGAGSKLKRNCKNYFMTLGSIDKFENHARKEVIPFLELNGRLWYRVFCPDFSIRTWT